MYQYVHNNLSTVRCLAIPGIPNCGLVRSDPGTSHVPLNRVATLEAFSYIWNAENFTAKEYSA